MATARAITRPGITKTDMEASRLVFVFVRDAKPKRKFAVPVPDGYTWAEFVSQVKAKLRITGVKEMYLASSGQKVTSLEDLQDIDELCVVEGQEPVHTMNGSGGGASEAVLRTGAASTSEVGLQGGQDYRQQFMTPDKHKVVVATGSDSISIGRPQDSDDQKYTRRTHPLKRMLQRLLPSIFAPSLPVTTKDTGSQGGQADTDRGMEITRLGKRTKKGRRTGTSLRSILLILAVATCLLTWFLFMFKASPAIPSS